MPFEHAPPMRCRTGFAALLALLLAACASPRGPAPLPDGHSVLPGTRVSLALPDGFRHAPELAGFESPDERTAIFGNVVPGSVYATMRSFSAEDFQKNGMLLDRHERVTVDRWPARLYHATQPVRETVLARWVLVFGDSSRSVVLTAVTPEERRSALEAPLRAALLSARWHRSGVLAEP